MILSFICLRSLGVAVALLALAGCTRGADDAGAPAAPAAAADGIGALKLVRQEYANAVAPEGRTVIDATEYAETELFAEQAEAKFQAVQVADPAHARAIRDGLARVRATVAEKAAPRTVAEHATATLALVEELLAGAVPDAIRGAVLASSRADEAIAVEEIVGDYRVALTSGMPRRIFRREGATLVPEPPAAGTVYVGALLRERRTKRFLPAASVTLAITASGERREAALAELWGDFHQYGAHVALPDDGPVTITVQASAPAYARHGDMLKRFVAPVTATFQGSVRAGVLTFDARPVQPPDADYAVGDDVLAAVAEAGTFRDAGPYRVGVIVEGPEPIWLWQDGAPALEPIASDATNHVEVVLVDRETGQLVPRAGVHVTFLADGAPASSSDLHPLLSLFAHYGETLALPPRATAVRVRIDPPALGALDRPRLAEPVTIELPLPARRSAA